MEGFDCDVIGSLFDSASTTNGLINNAKTESESFSLDDATAFLMRSSFNEAEGDDIDWGVGGGNDAEADDADVDAPEDVEAEADAEDAGDDDAEADDAGEADADEEPAEEEAVSEGETMGAYAAIKEELDAERETLSGVYERFFKEVVEPLFRKLEDSNINVAFDTTALLSSGIIKIELSHRNSDASAEMEINIFANTVNGEFLGMENSDGEAVATSLEDVSLDDLIGILIKVLG
jgi:hypothetical protein